MANRNHFNKDGSKSGPINQHYVVDTGRVFNLPVYQGTDKTQRPMMFKLLIGLWYAVGLPCWLWSVCIYIFGWFNITDPKEVITLIVSVVLGVTKAAVMWAEKGDLIWAKTKRLFKKKPKRKARVK